MTPNERRFKLAPFLGNNKIDRCRLKVKNDTPTELETQEIKIVLVYKA